MLEGANATVAFYSLEMIQRMCTLQKSDSADLMLLDKRTCLALARNPAVMNPLVHFLLANAASIPASDLEYVAATKHRLLADMARVENEPNLVVGLDNLLPPGR